MLHVYAEAGLQDIAVFEFFVRKLPKQRNFLLAAGLEQTIEYLENLRFTPTELDWLARTGRYGERCLAQLERLEFTGDIHAIREGTIFFPNEPILRVTAPLAQAQLIESRLINIMHLQTLIASKAARCVLAAPRQQLIDFGMRRAHGAEAAILAARAAYIAGFAGTATVLGEKIFHIPCYGTMAHSFIQAHDSEIEAFRNFSLYQHANVVLLIDTYDTEEAAKKVVSLAAQLADSDIKIKAVRLDSGDLAVHAREVRKILDAGGQHDIGIFCSGGLDEYRIRDLLRRDAPIDGFGIGTSLDVSADAPYLDCVYKLQEYAGRARRKRSPGKATWPGRKQVFRTYNDDGTMQRDVLTLEDDVQAGEALIRPVMKAGRRLEALPSLVDIRAHATAELGRLPSTLCSMDQAPAYPVEVSTRLKELTEQVDREFS